jgi:ATP-dependent DNA ligase
MIAAAFAQLKDPHHAPRAPSGLGDQNDAPRQTAAAKKRFGGPLALSKVHWVSPELVGEITYLSWSDDGLLRHTVFLGLREDKPATEVRREAPGAQ